MTRVFAQQIENEHFASDRFLKFREINWDYQDVDLKKMDAEFGTRFGKMQEITNGLEDRRMLDERRDT